MSVLYRVTAASVAHVTRELRYEEVSRWQLKGTPSGKASRVLSIGMEQKVLSHSFSVDLWFVKNRRLTVAKAEPWALPF